MSNQSLVFLLEAKLGSLMLQDEEATKIKEERLAAYNAKKAKSTCFDVLYVLNHTLLVNFGKSNYVLKFILCPPRLKFFLKPFCWKLLVRNCFQG